MSDPYPIAASPQPDCIELIEINLRIYDEGDFQTAHTWKFTPLRSVKIVGEAADEIWQRWTQLPDGQPARCHTPQFGVRFFQNAQTTLQASICWECNNIFINCGGSFSSYNFNARAPISRDLLNLVEHHLNIEAP